MEDFNHVKLPPLAMAAMFGQHLVLIPEVEQAPIAEKEKQALQARVLVPEAEPAQMATQPTTAHKTAPQPLQPQQEAPYQVLGNFSKKVLIVVHDANAVYCSEEDLTFITRVIAAVGLSMDHVALLNTHQKSITYPQLKAAWPAKVALYFGVEPSSIGVPMRFPHFQVQKWDDCTFLYAPALATLNGALPGQVDQKKQLWAALKKIFG
jgi:hypothetical protein